MPSRHISPQSFDEILSELGDDPAIPDPHGIRKPNAPKNPHLGKPDQNKSLPKLGLLDFTPAFPELKKWVNIITLGLSLICLGLVLFITYEKQNSSQDPQLDLSTKHINDLKREVSLLREEMLEIEDDLYESIDLIEVSIHSLNQKKPSSALKQKPQALPFESELRGWRYLGASQINGSHKAFFHNGMVTLMFDLGSLLLGDWKLTSASKGAATLTHPQDKSMTLRTSKAE